MNCSRNGLVRKENRKKKQLKPFNTGDCIVSLIEFSCNGSSFLSSFASLLIALLYHFGTDAVSRSFDQIDLLDKTSSNFSFQQNDCFGCGYVSVCVCVWVLCKHFLIARRCSSLQHTHTHTVVYWLVFS